ncbi:alpha/beta-hydrolase [Coprinellus micaceus]|uniref:Acyl-protein thioesterase 1 n=1 Tax=Coprinellus micaceus TaxID=71717 RepID=A0A4Y7SJ05_COPMI|nr:alpha/beta-hydrolase [Coprinellus micaceus]
MSHTTDQLLVIHPTAGHQHRATVIFVHGMGQLNTTWEAGFVKELTGRFPSVKWVLPQAPIRPVSWNQGMLRPSWFNVWNLPPTPSEYDEESIKKSVSTIQGLIRREVDAGTNVKDIFLVGFSQGAATSLCAGLTSQDEIGGIVSLSGWIPEAHRHASPAIYRAPPFPILWCHGTNDKEIPLSYGRDAEGFIKALSKEGASSGLQAGVITFETYEGLDHSTNDTELEDVAAWLSTQLQS